MKTKIILLITIFGSILLNAKSSDSAPLPVFVLVGTSNMMGVAAKQSELPQILKKKDTNVLFYEKGKWLPLEPGKVPLTKKPIFGPYITFGLAMSKELKQPVGIIKTKVTAVDDQKGYNKTVRIVKQAMQTRQIIIKGLVIQAGERDGSTEERANAFTKSMNTLIQKARKDFNDPNLPVVINLAIPNPGKWPYVMKIREAEKAMNIKGFKVIDCDSIPQVADKIHYSTEGELEFGRRLANGIIELLQKNK